MKCVRSRFTDGVDHSAGRPPILGRVIAGEHGEFLNRVHAQADADHASRPAVAVIIDAQSVQPVIVLCGPASRNRKLRAKTSIPALRAALERHLRFDRVDTR